MTRSQFISYVKKKLKENKCCYTFSPEKTVDCDGFDTTGYFDPEEPRLAISMGKPFNVWFPTLVHEFSHFNQWKEDPVWFNDTDDCLWYWLDGSNHYTKEQLAISKNQVQDIEYDCEKRVIKLIKQLDLPIDPIRYTQRANAYLFFYNLVLKKRMWSKAGFGPIDIKEVVDAMPTRLSGRYKNPPQKHLEILEEHIVFAHSKEMKRKIANMKRKKPNK